ncbi:MAG: peptidoglycan DD-metalloendopeptidase family protein [Ruminococcus sp.]|nr:peptidoglycan DD-metalloendopeptidase family protein [Ruminococcus sp.]
MNRKKSTGLRLMSAALCLSVLTASATANWSPLRDVPVSAKTLSELQEEREANEAKIAEKQKELDSLQSDLEKNEEYQEVLQEKIALQQDNLDIAVEELDRINESIDETTEAISKTEDEITVMEADIEIGLDEFKLRLRAMYVQGSDSLATVLVGATDFYDLLSKYELMSRVAKHDNDLVNQLKEDLEACNEKKEQLEVEKASLSKQQSEQQEKKSKFTAALLELQDTYAETTEAQETMEREKEKLNAGVKTLEENNEALNEQEEEIKAAIAAAAEKKRQEEEAAEKAEQERLAAEAAAAVAEKAEQERLAAEATAAAAAEEEKEAQEEDESSESAAEDSTDSSEAEEQDTDSSEEASNNAATEAEEEAETETTSSASSTSFSWPCPGYYTISSGFGSRWSTNHNGIDIAGGNAGAAVTASRSGTVVRVVNSCTHNYAKSSSCGCGGGYGNYVVIQHDSTYSTLYGHLASVTVSVGDTVSHGQTIGYVGSTGFSTGFHLHFEVRVNGTQVDPMQYLG